MRSSAPPSDSDRAEPSDSATLRYRLWVDEQSRSVVRIGMLAAFAAGWLLMTAGWLFDPTATRFLPSVLVASPGFLVVTLLTFARRPGRWFMPTIALTTAIWGASIVWGAHHYLEAPELGTTAVCLVLLFGPLVFHVPPRLMLPISVLLGAEHVSLLVGVPNDGSVAGGVVFHVVLTVGIVVAAQLVAWVIDQTRRRQFEQGELIAARNARVEQLLRERAEFFTGISHELRTPVAAIRAYAEMIADRSFAKSEEWHARAGGALDQVATEILVFIDEILDLARLQQGGPALALRAVDVAQLVRDVQPTIESLALAAQLRTRVTASDHALVYADPDRLRTVILNLVSNAIKFTPADGELRVRVQRSQDEVELRVTDTGAGIPPEAADRIFDPFYRVRGTSPRAGYLSSGFGLSLVRAVVEAHGGTVTVQSELGAGSTFVVRLPAVVDAASPTARVPEAVFDLPEPDVTPLRS